MRSRIREAARWAASLSLAAALFAVSGAVATAADNPRSGPGYFPNFTLTTQDGVPVHFYDDVLKGKIVAIDLIYTTCKYACPLETARLSQVARLLGDRMGRDIFFYSITIDPDHDTPAVLKEYATEISGRAGVDVPHRQEGRDRDDQQETRVVLGAGPQQPGRPPGVSADWQ